MKWSRNRAVSIAALGAASALVLGACSSGPSTSPTSDAAPSDDQSESSAPAADGDVELKVAFWGDFGLQSDGDSLVDEYEADNPGVKITLVPGEHPATHEALQQYLIAGSGAPDVQAIDLDYVVQFREQADKFVNLKDFGADHRSNRKSCHSRSVYCLWNIWCDTTFGRYVKFKSYHSY